jgi:hypothetical protein
MNPTVNMILTLEKELELERKGLRRTRRWIGDACQVTDARWYQGELGPVSKTNHFLGKVSPAGETKSRREPRRSILARLWPLPRTRRQPAFNEC